MKPKTVHFIGKKYLAAFKHHVYGKRQIQVDNFSKQKMSRKQLKTYLMDEKLRETTKLCVKIMNSKQQVKGKLDHMVQVRICRQT